MQASSPIPKASIGRTFFTSILLLGAVALVQLVAVAWMFIARFHSGSPDETAAAMRNSEAQQESLKLNDTFTPAETTQTTSLPKPTPIIKAEPEKHLPQELGRQAELVETAKRLRDRGDMSTALIRLREAQALSPDNPGVIAEMAITYEKMGLADKAAEQWQRIRAMGESAGIYYAAADAKLKAASAPAAVDKEVEGFQPGSVLALVEITKADSDDQPGDKFTLKIPVKTLPGTQIDVHDVVLQVFFYDMLDGKSVVRTNANVNYKWLTTPSNWNDTDIQILQVEYTSSSLSAKGKGKDKDAEDRKYFGYVVRLYYKNSLQDMRAEPVRLLQQYPPPVTLSNEELQ